jgi:type II secretory pathway pseudopilin PulG
MRHTERGAALLEAIVALAILATAGTSLVTALAAALRSETDVARAEQAVQAADRVLTAMTLLTRNDLDQRIGSHAVGEFVVLVQRPRPTLYRISVAETRAAEVEMLVTLVYRPEPVVP